MKLEMEYAGTSLSIIMRGRAKKRDIKKLKKKVYFLIEEYGIDDIVIDKTNINVIDGEAFYDFLDAYDVDYGGKLTLIGE